MKTRAHRPDAIPHPADLTCNDLVNPLGVDGPVYFSWRMAASGTGQRQTAYQILTGTDPHFGDGETADRWDSGKVLSRQCIHIHYDGPETAPRERLYWKIRLWDKEDLPTRWSTAAWFESGLKGDFRGQWICREENIPLGGDAGGPAPLLRTRVSLPERVVRARVYLCGVGYHTLFVNDTEITDEILAPGITQYDQRLLYQTVDITSYLYKGDNALGVMLGNGFYNCFTDDAWAFRWAAWRNAPRLWLQAHFWLEDGQEIVETTGPHWRGADGPIVMNGLRNGETYDARRVLPGWSAPGFNDRDFLPVRVAGAPGETLVSQQYTPIRVVDTLPCAQLKQLADGSWLYDFGHNVSGTVLFEALGFADATITFRYGELLGEDGSLDISNIGQLVTSGDFQTDRYIMSGNAMERWAPRYTYHGFRYVNVSGYPAAMTSRMVKARVIHTDLPARGRFECSDDIVNSLQTALVRSTLTNYHGIPTDCPHREKNGWTGDAHLSAEQVLMNLGPDTAYRKWMDDIADAQRPSGQLPGIVPTGGWGYAWGNGPAWDAALILIPWYQYVYRGDRLILEGSFPAIRRYIDYLWSREGAGGLYEFGLDDWCPPAWPQHNHCPGIITDTAYAAVLTRTAGLIAAALGQPDEAALYAARAGQIRENFRRSFITPDGRITGQSQTALACALYQGMLMPGEEPAFVDALAQAIEDYGGRIDCGILGSKYVLHALTDHDRIELAYRVVTQPEYPGWGNWIARGATTLWEDWEGKASQNHHMYSDVGMFFYRGLAGIRAEEAHPGFTHFTLRPAVAGPLTWVNGTHDSPYGPIVSNWRIEQHTLLYHCSVPPGCTASLSLPGSRAEVLQFSSVPDAPRCEDGRLCFELPTGRYRFECRHQELCRP